MNVIIINYVHLPFEQTEEAALVLMLQDIWMWSKYFPDDFIILGGYF
jgi:hypothetical protein